MDKITLIVHPFFYMKDEIEDIYLSGGHAPIPKNPFKEFTDYASPESARRARRRFGAFIRGVEFARDGLLVVLRSDPEIKLLNAEKALFKNIQDLLPADNFHFEPSLNCFERTDDIKGALEYLKTRFGSVNSLRDAQVFSFGESLDACVTSYTCGLHKRGEFSKPAVILAKYSTPHVSLGKAKSLVADFLGDRHANELGYAPSQVLVRWDR